MKNDFLSVDDMVAYVKKTYPDTPGRLAVIAIVDAFADQLRALEDGSSLLPETQEALGRLAAECAGILGLLAKGSPDPASIDHTLQVIIKAFADASGLECTFQNVSDPNSGDTVTKH